VGVWSLYLLTRLRPRPTIPFGKDAERYDRARPRYPEELVDRIVERSPGAEIVDVGCGTGIAARQFQAAGCRVLGIEVDPRMAHLARETGVEVEVSRFEAWDPAGRQFDSVIAAQAWHWVDPFAGAEKVRAVLRPGGLMAAFWNAFEAPSEVADAFAAVYRRVIPDSPFHFGGACSAAQTYSAFLTKTEEGIRQAGGFAEPETWRFEWEWSYTRDAWLDVVPTQGNATGLPPEKLEELLAGIGASIDVAGGSFTAGYTTVAVVATCGP
jgi:SAM-dependent methyltransferase